MIFRTRVSICSATLFFVLLCACGPGGGPFGSNNEPSGDHTEFRQLLRAFNDEIVEVEPTVDENTRAWGDFVTASTLMDPELADEALDRQLVQLAALETSVERLWEVEEQLQALMSQGQTLEPVTVTAAVVTLYGVYTFAQWLRKKSDEMTATRMRRDEARNRVAAGDADAVQEAEDAQSEMWDQGHEVIGELTRKVTTKLITPGDPKDVVGVLIQTHTGNQIENGLKAISTTDDCEGGFEAPDCRIAFDTTMGGSIQVPSPGPVHILIAGGDGARVSIAQATVDPSTPTTLEREVVPIESATPENVRENDAGALTEPVPVNNGANNGANNGVNNGVADAGIYPNQPFIGIQIEYEVEGGTLGSPTDERPDQTTMHRKFEMGRLTSDTVVVSGTITSYNNHSGVPGEDPHAEANVLLTDGSAMEQLETETDATTGTWTQPFRLEIDATGDLFVQFNIAGYWADGTDTGLVIVSGNLLRQ